MLLGTLAGDLYSAAQETRAQTAGCSDALTYLGEAAVLSVGTLFQAALLPGIMLAALYGIYAFGARNGLIEHSYAAGSPDAGYYIGQCYPCNALIDDVVAEYNGLGYSGTNSGGELYIINSTWAHNRAGIVPNSGSYEGCAPERETTIVGNIVHSNSNGETPAIGAAKDAQGNGIITPGGLDNLIERNLVYDHDIAGIALVPFPEEEPINGIPDPPDDGFEELGCEECGGRQYVMWMDRLNQWHKQRCDCQREEEDG